MALGLTPQQILEKGNHSLLRAAPHWERVLLGEIADVQNGAAFKSKYFTQDTGLPLIRIRDVGKATTDNHYKGPYDEEYLVYPGDIIIGMDGDFNAAVWSGDVGLLNQRVCRLNIRSALVDRHFLFCCLQPFLDAINAETSSVTVKHLSSRTVAQIPLPLPPLNEQRRIVAKIEELFSELDKGVESMKTARAQLKTYRQSLLKAAFEGRLTEQWRRDNADKLETADQLLQRIRKEQEALYERQMKEWKVAVAEWEQDGKSGKKPRSPTLNVKVLATDPKDLDPVKSTWSACLWARLGGLVNVVSGGTPKGIKGASGDEIPYFRVGDMESLGNYPWMYHSGTHVSRQEAAELGLRVLLPGTIVFPKRGGAIATNKKRRLGRSACIDLNTMAVTDFPESLDPTFVWYWFQNLDLFSISDGSNVPQINNKNVEPLLFPVPSLSEQREIVGVLESALSTAEELDKTILKSLERADNLGQSILKRAFEGKLVPQDPDDEPARVLLERIRAEREKAPKPRGRRRKANA